MRVLALLPLVLATTACLAPGERDPTRYPWQFRKTQPMIEAHGAIAPPIAQPLQPSQLPGPYCDVGLQPRSSNGIVVGGKAPSLVACSAPAPRR